MLSKILDWLAPIQDLMSKLGVAEKKVTREVVDVSMSLRKEGDVFLTYESLRFTNWFIKGDLDHASIVSSKLNIVEAVKPKVREVDFEEFLFKKDKFLHLRPRAPEHIAKLSAANSLSFVGTNYDRSFSKKDKRVYCSELVVRCYEIESKEVFKRIKDNNILPIDLIQYCDVVYRFNC